uniref:type VI secretion system baseplate subunit TssK n=1 Tax=Stenotrophomonas maltophilia TaxID=40324 RepID=UPI0013DD78EA
EEIDIAFPRLGFDVRKTQKPGYVSLGVARVLEIRDKAIIFDDRYVPPLLICNAHPTVDGWMDRIIGWMDNK